MQLPELIEDEFHEFDAACTHCEIYRQFDSDLESCPAVNCATTAGDDAYTTLVANGCASDCDSTTCEDAYHTLRAFHDLCPEGSLSEASELGLHDFEEECTSCNVVDDDDSQLSCTALSVPSASTASMAVPSVVALVLLALNLMFAN